MTDPASFGFSIGAIIAVGDLAWKLYKRCKTAPESFYNISQELQSLHAVLKECEEAFTGSTIPPPRADRLETIISGCQGVLEHLDGITCKYGSLGKQSKRTWDRMRWHSEDIGEIRSRLTSHISMLTAFLSTSQARVEQKLDELLREFREGRMEGSVISTLTVDSLSIDERAQWRTVRKELEEHGITLDMFSANTDFIVRWFADAVANGDFEEDQADDDEELGTLPNGHASSSSAASRANITSLADEAFEDIQADHDEDHGTPPPQYTSNSSAASQADTTSRAVRSSTTKKTRGERPKAPRMALFLASLSRPGKALIKTASAGDIGSAQALIEDSTRFALVEQQDLHRALWGAASEGHMDMSSLLLSNGADVNKSGKNGETPLSRAARGGHIDVCNTLIRAGADINKSDKNGETPLSRAVRGGYIDVCNILIQAGTDINKADEDGRTPLLFAAKAGHVDVCNTLIRSGADVNKANKFNGWTPLSNAASNRNVELCNILIKAGAEVSNPNNTGETMLSYAITTGRIAICTTLIQAGVDVNEADEDGSTPLGLAARAGYIELCNILVKAGADVNGSKVTGSATPLEYAAAFLKLKVCELLLQAGADVNQSGRYRFGPLQAAEADPFESGSLREREKIIRILRAASADKRKF